MGKSTAKQAGGKADATKPEKPYPEFPLFPHATKRWAKKIRGKLVYFGKWDDPDAALAKYLDQKDDLHAGRVPRAGGNGLTIRDLLNRFLSSKRHLVDTGELASQTFASYHATGERLKDAFGLTRIVEDLENDDFEHLRANLAKTRGPVALGTEIQRCRVVFNFAHNAGLIERPVRYGVAFKRPSKKTLRRARQENGKRMFEAAQIRRLLDNALPNMKAMILLGVNCGMGNSDCGRLREKHIDLDAGWINYPRPKTGIERRCPLWPETTAAIHAAIETRPKPKDAADADLVFLTRRGWPWARDAVIKDGGKIRPAQNAISTMFRGLLVDAGMFRGGLNFYALRHTFETIAGATTDQVAVDQIMGHARDDMASLYREGIDDKRLEKVTEHVRKWLFPKPAKKGGKKAKGRNNKRNSVK